MTIRLSTKFKIGIGIIVFTAVGIVSLFFYHYVRDLYIEQTYQKTDLVLGYIDATIGYVQTELRPKMFDILPNDDFVREAMSASFVNTHIMNRFSKMFPGYVFRRVALDPMNAVNHADKFETDFIHQFAKVPEGPRDWKGIVTKGRQRYFIHVKAVIAQKQCLGCHGNPVDTPQPISELFGRVHDHNWRPGEVVGIESLAIPMDPTFSRIAQVAFSIFCGGLTWMVFLFFVLNFFYYFVTQSPLERAGSFFRSIVSGKRGLDVKFEVKGHDEISELAESFNHLIDHLRQSQQDLMASELKHREIFEGSKDAIVVADPDGRILDINPSGMDLMDFKTTEEVVGNIRIHDFFESRDSLVEFLSLLEGSGFVKEYETRFKTKGGAKIDVLITGTLQKTRPGQPRGYNCIIRNITLRKRMEEQVRQADRLASIGQLAAGVAHEINNPLSIVLGYAKLLKEDTTDSSAREDLEVVYNNAAACKKIVEDLLNFSRQTVIHLSETDIHETIESVASALENGFTEDNITLVRDYDPRLTLVTIDAGKIRQVCMNLLTNARQAIEGGGRITVSTRLDADNGGFFIIFEDTGSGVPPDIRDRIFEPFFTTKEPGQGTGLGLTVSYGIVKEHRGNISFQAEDGKGSAFRVWLPLGAN